MDLIDINKNFFQYRDDIVLLENEQAVLESVKNIIENYKYEVPFNTAGSDIKELLLKPTFYVRTVDIITDLKNTINDGVEDTIVDDIVVVGSDITITLLYQSKKLTLRI